MFKPKLKPLNKLTPENSEKTKPQVKQIYKILLAIGILLIMAGVIFLIVKMVSSEPESNASVTDTFDDETKIDSKTNLAVTGGQVKLELHICYANGEATTTNWGSDLVSCTGVDKRCLDGVCLTCGGWMNAGYCWYEGGYEVSCTAVCYSKGGVYNNTCDWINDPEDCSTAAHYDAGACLGTTVAGPFYYPQTNGCYYHEDGNDLCDLGAGADLYRICACDE